MSYDAFLSYSRDPDEQLAARIQSGLQRFAKPWYRSRAIRVFRDRATLSINPKLWSSIEKALGESKYLMVLASPDAAQSPWVRKEIGYWLARRSTDTLLLVLTGGEITWEAGDADFDWTRTSALSQDLSHVFDEEPLYLDLRWAKDTADMTLSNLQFRDSIADLAATLRGVPKDALIGEHVREHRRTKHLTISAVIVLMLLMLSAAAAAIFAIHQTHRAKQEQAQSELTSYLELLASAESQWLSGNVVRAKELLSRCDVEHRSWEWDHLHRRFEGSFLTLETPFVIVRDVRFSPDGRKLATGGDGGLILWDPATGERLRTLVEDKTIAIVRFSPDGSTLASADWNGNVQVWDPVSGRNITVLDTEERVFGLSFSPDGERVAIACRETVRLWDPGRGQLITSVVLQQPPEGILIAMKFSPDGRQLAAAGYDVAIGVWDAYSGQKIQSLVHHDRVFANGFSADGRYLATASTRNVALWELATGQQLFSFDALSSEVWGLAFSADGQKLVTAGWDHRVKVWEIAERNARLLAEWKGHDIRPTSVTFSPDGTRVASGGFDHCVKIWDLRSEGAGQSVPLRLPAENSVESVAFDSSGLHLASASVDLKRWQSRLVIWELQTATPVVTVTQRAHLEDLAMSADGRRVATIDRESIKVRHATTGEEIFKIPESGGDALVYSPDGKWLVSAHVVSSPDTGRGISLEAAPEPPGELGLLPSPNGSDAPAESPTGEVRLWDANQGTLIRSLSYRHPLTCIDVSPDSKQIVAGSDDANVIVWNATSGKPRKVIRGHTVPILAVACCPNGKWIAAAGGNHEADVRESCEIRIFDLTHGREQLILRGHETPVNCLAFTRDGRRLVSCAGRLRDVEEPGEVRVWELASGHEVLSLTGHRGAVWKAAFSPNGKTLATAGWDSVIRMWSSRRPHEVPY